MRDWDSEADAWEEPEGETEFESVQRGLREEWFALWGRRMLRASLLFLIGGKMLFRALNGVFPPANGQFPFHLLLLLPVLLAVMGLGLLFIAWSMNPARDDMLELSMPRRPDGRFFSRMTTWLGGLTCGLAAFGSAVVLLDEANPVGITAAYTGLCMSLFLFYLCLVYRESHRVVTTYINLYTPLLAILLVPLTWPLMLVFSIIRTDVRESW